MFRGLDRRRLPDRHCPVPPRRPGTLVLALAVTAIEVALIISLMLAGGPDKAALARDTVYATVMIISSGVIGISLLLGGWRHREQTFRIEGAGPAFAAMVTLATLVLIMPVFTKTAPGASYSPTQLAFVGVSSLLLWCVFVFFQTVRHRDYFLPRVDPDNEASHAPPPGGRQALGSLALLLVSLVAVVGLAKMLSPLIEAAVRAAGAPHAVVGIAIALVVLLPETVSALRAALANRLQTSLNLASAPRWPASGSLCRRSCSHPRSSICRLCSVWTRRTWC